MVFVLVRHRVKNIEDWRRGFDAALRFRQWGGERVYYIFSVEGNPNEVVALFQWDSLSHARKFFASAEIHAAMEQAGVEGESEILYLNEIDWSRLE